MGRSYGPPGPSSAADDRTAAGHAWTVAALARVRAHKLLDPFLAGAREGHGASIVVEGVRGSGRTTLLRAAAELAGEAGFTVARARASDLERGSPLALATRLLEPLRRAIPRGDLDALLAGEAPAELVGAISTFSRRLVRRTAETGGGLALIVDDVHVADDASLHMLALLYADLDRLPLVIVLSSARGEWPRGHRVLSGLHEAADLCHSPPPLSAGELTALIAAGWPQADPHEMAGPVRAATGGNARLTADLLAELSEQNDAPDADAVRAVLDAPAERTTAWIAGRLGRLGSAAGAVVPAVAVFAGGARLSDVAALCGLEPDPVAVAADDLASAGILSPGEPLAFTAPLLEVASLALLAPLARRTAHEAAARILLDGSAAPRAIAEQLLRCGPLGDPRVPDLLRAEAAACAADDPARASALLTRGLREQPEASVRAELLRDLARLERRTGTPTAGERFAEARRLHPDAAFRHRAAIDEALLRYEIGEYRAATAVIADAVADGAMPRGRLGADLRAVYVCAASRVPALRGAVAGLREAVLADADGEARGLQRAAVAHLLLLDRLGGAPKEATEGLAELAWGTGALLDPSLPALSIPALGFAMMIGDDAEQAIELTGRVVSARRPDGARGHGIQGAAQSLRAWAYLVRGDLHRAERDAVQAMRGPVLPPFTFVWSGLAVLAACALERGEQVRAAEMISLLRCAPMGGTVREPLVHIAESRLALAERRPEAALASALRAGDRLDTLGIVTLGPVQSWRAPAALAELMAGRRTQAVDQAADALAISTRAGAPAAIIRDLRVAGLCAGVPGGLPELEEAVLLTDAAPLRLEGIHALVEFGTALRRAGQREFARTVLRRALQRGREAGATQLVNLAEAELAAAGARERRRAQTGLDALTPSQLRVVEMAADGLTTRQMAEELVVSPKTIEFHLGQAYRKLGIRSRAELAGLLDGNGAGRR